MRFRMCIFNYLIGCILMIGMTLANPTPDTTPMPKVWDNLFGTAGEPLSLYDVYLVSPEKVRSTVLFAPLRATYYWDSTGKSVSLGSIYHGYYSPKVYSRINMPISIAYGISRSLEIEFRRAFISRSKTKIFRAESLLFRDTLGRLETTSGMGDISFRLRTKILGEQDKPLYLAAGIGVKFASSAEFYPNDDLPISPRSTDIFFGIYNAIKLGKITFPNALTYSHTGRYLNGLPIGEIITYRIGIITEIHRFADLNFSLSGYEITDESKSINIPSNLNLSSGITNKIIDLSPQGISKTTVEAGLTIKISKIRAILSGGLRVDLRGKRTYEDDFSSILSLQVGF